MRPCILCGQTKSGMRYAKHATCMNCIDKAIDLLIETEGDISGRNE